MSLSEQIEALQAEWRKTSKIPNCNSFEEGYAKAHEWLARELAPLLVRAKEQEAELADLHEQIMRYQADPQYDARFIEGQEKTEAMLREQHSADLREVAEMAIDVVTTGNKTFIRANSRSIADSILSAFWERKAQSASEPKERR